MIVFSTRGIDPNAELDDDDASSVEDEEEYEAIHSQTTSSDKRSGAKTPPPPPLPSLTGSSVAATPRSMSLASESDNKRANKLARKIAK